MLVLNLGGLRSVISIVRGLSTLALSFSAHFYPHDLYSNLSLDTHTNLPRLSWPQTGRPVTTLGMCSS
jgi:hypothetical protein